MSSQHTRKPGRVPAWRLRRWLPAVLASAGGLAALAQPPAGPAPAAGQPAAPAKAPAAPEKPEKTVSFVFEDKPWNQVLDWFAKESDLVLITTEKPTGSVTIKTDPMRRYTIREVVDLLNEALAQQKYILIRRSRSFGIYPASDKLPPEVVTRITQDELKTKGDTEVVSVTVPLKTLNADDIVPYVLKLKSNFGEVYPFGANSIILQDTAKNVRRIIHDLEALEDEKKAGDSLTYPCKYIRASAAAESLRTLLSDAQTQVTQQTAGQPQFGGFPSWGQPPQPDPRGRDRGTGGGMAGRFKSVQISVVEQTNTILITGPADKIAAAQKFLKDIDVAPQPGAQPRMIGPPEIRTYDVPAGTAADVTKTLTDVYKSSNLVRITALPGSNRIMVYAPPADQFDIAAQLKVSLDKPTGGGAGFEVLPISAGKDPAEVIATLKRLFPSTTTSETATLEPRTDPTPAIIVRGTQQQIDEMKAALKVVDPQAGPGIQGLPGSERVQIVPIGQGNAAILAQELARVLKEMGNPVEVRGVEPAKKPEPAPAPPPAPNKKSSLPKLGPDYVVAQIVDPQAQPKPADPKQPKIVLSVVGGNLVVTSDDPATTAMVAQLARMMTSSKVEDNLMEVIRLKNAPAEEAARVINEVFNGPPPQQQGGGGRGGGLGGPLGFLTQFAGLGAAAPANPTPGRVRVVAEKGSNSLIVVKASRADLLSIKGLLAKAIDNAEVESGAVMRSRIIPLENAEAGEVANVLREVFANLTQSRGGGGRGGMASFGPFPFPIPGQQPGGQQQQAQLTIGVMEQTNSIVVNSNEAVYKEVEALVKSLDEAAEGNTEVVRVVQLKNGVDPALIQQAIDAIAGRTPTQQQPMGGRFGTPGIGGGFGTGGSPFGGGAFGSPFGGRGMGGMPGMGGGTRGGGFNRGGIGGTRGGGGGQRGGGGGNRRSSLDPGGGPYFFDHRDTDVPSAPGSLIYDPENPTDLSAAHGDVRQVRHDLPAIPVAAQQPPTAPQPNPAQPGQPKPPAGQPGALQPSIPAPSPEARAEALSELGLLILRAKNPEEMEQLLKFIEYITNVTKPEVKLRVVPMVNGDATQIVNQLNTIFSRVNVTAGSTSVVPAQPRPGGFGGPLGGIFGGFGGQQQAQQAQTVGSVFFLALPRFNSIMFAAPEARVPEVENQIKQLDQPSSPQMKPATFQLKKAAAQTVATQIQNFFNARYPGESLQTNQTRVTFDVSSNTVIVQASPADMKDIAELIGVLDTKTSNAVNELRVIRLRNAFADEVAQVILSSIGSSVLNPAASATSTGLPAGGAAGGAFGQAGQPGGAFGQAGGAFGQAGGQQFGQGAAGQFATGGALGQAGRAGAGAFNTLSGGATGLTTKTTSLRFYSSQGGQVVESGFLEDVHVIPEVRLNAVVVAAPERTMRLIEKLIEELDTPSAARADVKVFNLRRADAQAILQLLTQLFSATGGAGAGAGQFGQLGGQFGALLGGQQGAFGGQGAAGQPGGNRPLLTLTGQVAEGTNLLGLRITVDPRTNSLIVAGSPTDLDTIRAIIARLEDAEAPQLVTRVYKLRNAAAADVRQAVLTFLQQRFTIESTQFATTFQTIMRQVFIQEEPVSNTLLIAAAPALFDEVIRLIEKVDAPPTQVFVQVLIAEVSLRNNQDFGVEVGLQSPILFARGGGVAGGAAGDPGFNFNTTAPLPNTTAASPGVVGFQGLGNLGVGRAGSTGVGGFVFSAGSQSFNLLIRALKSQGRVDVLSRPQLLCTDNQTSFFQVGQDFPIPTGLVVGVGQTTQGIEYRPTGITLRVTPRINPDGKVLMRVEPQISNATPTQVNLGNGQFATAFDTQTLMTTVLASDGETVVLGGLIRRSDVKSENKIPWFGDLPYVGAAFRYRTQSQERREILFIVTPHLIRSDADLARVSAEEARKMSWSLKEVYDIHTHGGAVLSGRNPYDHGPPPHACPPGHPGYVPPGFAPAYPPAPRSAPVPGFPPPSGPLPGGIVPETTPPAPAAAAPGSQPLGFPQPVQAGPLPGGIVPDAAPAAAAPPQPSFAPPPATPAVPVQPLYPAYPAHPGIAPSGAWVPPAGQPGVMPPQQPQPVPPPAATPQTQQPTGTSAKPTKEGRVWSVFGR